MFETLSILPVSFWVAVALMAFGAAWAARKRRTGIGIPMLAVLGTVAVWYVGDAFYNGYAENYATTFSSVTLEGAWCEVAWFVVVFSMVAPSLHGWLNRRYMSRGSQVHRMMQTGAGQQLFQLRLNSLLWACQTVWLVLAAWAAIRLGSEMPYYLFPFLGHNADPWARGRVGGGIDSLLSMAGYLQVFVAATFGVLAALAQNPRVRLLAVAGCLLTWPYFIFERNRNPILAIVMPALLTWVFLRLRGSRLRKFAVLAAAFFLVEGWFSLIIENRSEMSIVSALEEKGFSLQHDHEVHHLGLNMYEELCWINAFIEDRTFETAPGQEYFSELVNPIPRTLWPSKPMIGIDYAVARGQSHDNGQAGVGATVSTGMIGQGVLNFGRILGPAFVALLMALWTAGLARLDLQGQEVGRIPLYALGIILTFNMGRDITFITLYTFAFGAAIVWWLQRRSSRRRGPEKAVCRTRDDRRSDISSAGRFLGRPFSP